MSDRRFPLFVDLAGRRAVVVGGGPVGLRRAKALAEFGAEVTLISPRCGEAPPPQVRYLPRPYAPGIWKGLFWRWPPPAAGRQTARWGRRPGPPGSSSAWRTARRRAVSTSPPCVWNRAWWPGWSARPGTTRKPPPRPRPSGGFWRDRCESGGGKPGEQAGPDPDPDGHRRHPGLGPGDPGGTAHQKDHGGQDPGPAFGEDRGQGAVRQRAGPGIALRGGGPDGAQQQRPAHGAGPPASPGGLLPPGGPPGRAGAAQGRLPAGPRPSRGLFLPPAPGPAGAAVPRAAGGPGAGERPHPPGKAGPGGVLRPGAGRRGLKAPGAGAPDQPDLLPGGDAPRRRPGNPGGAGPPGL